MRGRVRSLISPVAVTATGERVPLFRGAEQVALEYDRLVVGEHTAATSYYCLMLPVAPGVSCPCLDALLK